MCVCCLFVCFKYFVCLASFVVARLEPNFAHCPVQTRILQALAWSQLTSGRAAQYHQDGAS